MSHPGVHCAGCAGGGAAVPAGVLVLAFGSAWVAENLIAVAAVCAACAVLSLAAVIALSRATARREAAFGARLVLVHQDEARTVTATVIPQVTEPSVQVIEHRYYLHAIPEAAPAVIRAAIPGPAGDATTGRNSHVQEAPPAAGPVRVGRHPAVDHQGRRHPAGRRRAQPLT